MLKTTVSELDACIACMQWNVEKWSAMRLFVYYVMTLNKMLQKL